MISDESRHVTERVHGESTFYWENPPEVIKRNRKKWWEELLPKVMVRPGFWACIREYETNPDSVRGAQKQVRDAYERGELPAGRWEVRSATVDGVGKVYVRFNELEVSDE